MFVNISRLSVEIFTDEVDKPAQYCFYIGYKAVLVFIVKKFSVWPNRHFEG